MLPSLASNYQSNLDIGDSVLASQLGIHAVFNRCCRKLCTDFEHLRLSQLVGVNGLSMIVAQLCVLVMAIISPRPSKKMVWSYALGVIALVANYQSFFDMTMRQSVRHSMRSHGDAGTKRNATISAKKAGASPLPAIFGFIDSGPKPGDLSRGKITGFHTSQFNKKLYQVHFEVMHFEASLELLQKWDKEGKI